MAADFRLGLLSLLLAACLVGGANGLGKKRVATLTPEEQAIEQARLNIYKGVTTALTLQAAQTVQPGVVTTVPRLPFAEPETAHEIVLLNVRDLRLKGYKFREFNIPPGSNVATTEAQVLLNYQSYLQINSPFNPPSGYTQTSPLAILTALPGSAVTNPAAVAPVAITPPAGKHINVTFDVLAGISQCATYSSNGTIAVVPSAKLGKGLVCLASGLGPYTLTITPAPPPLPPLPPPPKAPSPAPAPGPESAPVPGPAQAPSGSPPGGLLPPGGGAPPPPLTLPPPGEGGSTSSGGTDTGLIVGLTVGLGVPLLLAAAAGLFYASRAMKKRTLENMEKESDKRASLETALVGGSRAPAAGALRTRPYLEAEDIAADRI